jgi:hypothetical protein
MNWPEKESQGLERARKSIDFSSNGMRDAGEG